MIKQGLRLPAKGHNALFSQLCKMLGKRRLTDPHPLDQLANAEFLRLNEMAQAKEPRLVREDSQEFSRLT
ncbi:hypothetical protein EH31_01480 [Erythrobacter longus]|uniref:Uncharacterized protein n=1 Tax=Erythrobacter longus TaxID=1044 RepID=A0A074M989_ERYLO|nr:hypothetical protein EH31_01480 [Erythrobacter longus]